MNKRKTSFILSILSGILFIISGTDGVSSWKTLENIILHYLDLGIIKIIFVLIIIIASFGGLSVIFGGYLIYKRKTKSGILIISIGSGAGLISFLLNIFILIVTDGLSLGWFLSFSTVAIILSITARIIAKPKSKKRRGVKKLLMPRFL
jgi:hypothetical protein